MNLAELKELEEREAKLREEASASKGQSRGSFEFDHNEYVGIGKNTDAVVRIIGEPFKLRKLPTDHKLVLVSQILKDDKKGYMKVYWEHEFRDYKAVPKEDFILTRLLDKVRESKWVKWTEQDLMDAEKKLHRTPEGNIVNEKGHNGHYVYLHDKSKVFERVQTNSREGDKYPKKFYPAAKVMMNVIDRLDSWCKDNKKAKILCSRKEKFNIKESGEERWTVDAGFPLGAYNKLIETHASFTGDWTQVDTVVQKKFNGTEFDDYQVLEASEYRRFISQETKNLVSNKPLTDEEKAYQLVDFDKRYRPRYRAIKENIGGLFRLCDMELGTDFSTELERLVVEESKMYNDQQVEVQEEKKEIPSRRQQKSSTTGYTEEDFKKLFPKLLELTDKEQQTLKDSIETIQNGIPVWKSGVVVARCFDEKNCVYGGTKTPTSFPMSVAACPQCGKRE